MARVHQYVLLLLHQHHTNGKDTRKTHAGTYLGRGKNRGGMVQHAPKRDTGRAPWLERVCAMSACVTAAQSASHQGRD